MPVTASSDCPTPTVSTRIRSKPPASRTSHTSRVLVASPPSDPRVAMERIYTPRSIATDSIRIRSPSSAPPEKGLVASTATTATVCPRCRQACTSRSARVDFPAPGGPVIPTRWARPSRGCTAESSCSKPDRPFSTMEMARASAAVRPAARSAIRVSRSMVEGKTQGGKEAKRQGGKEAASVLGHYRGKEARRFSPCLLATLPLASQQQHPTKPKQQRKSAHIGERGDEHRRGD